MKIGTLLRLGIAGLGFAWALCPRSRGHEWPVESISSANYAFVQIETANGFYFRGTELPSLTDWEMSMEFSSHGISCGALLDHPSLADGKARQLFAAYSVALGRLGEFSVGLGHYDLSDHKFDSWEEGFIEWRSPTWRGISAGIYQSQTFGSKAAHSRIELLHNWASPRRVWQIDSTLVVGAGGVLALNHTWNYLEGRVAVTRHLSPRCSIGIGIEAVYHIHDLKLWDNPSRTDWIFQFSVSVHSPNKVRSPLIDWD